MRPLARSLLLALAAAPFLGADCGEPEEEPPPGPSCAELLEESGDCRNFEGVPNDSCPGLADIVVLCFEETSPPCVGCVEAAITSPNPTERVFCCPTDTSQESCPQC